MTGDGANWFGFKDWLDRQINPAPRRKLEVVVMVALVFLAGFAAWKDQAALTQSMKSENEKLSGGRSYWMGVAASRGEEVAGLRAQLAQRQSSQAPLSYPSLPPIKVEVASAAPPARHLTENQKDKLRANLAPLAKEIRNLAIGSESESEAQRYAREFIDVFKVAGVTTAPDIFLGYPRAEADKGIFVGFKDLNKKSHAGMKFVEALRRSDFEVGIILWESSEASDNDFNFFVGPR